MSQTDNISSLNRGLRKTERALQQSRQTILNALAELEAGRPRYAKSALKRYAKEVGLKQ